MLVKSKRLKYGIHIDTYIYTDTHAYTHICIWYMHLPATVAHSRNIWCSTKTLLLCEDADHLCAWQLASMYAWMYVCACAVSIIKTSYATALHTNSTSVTTFSGLNLTTHSSTCTRTHAPHILIYTEVRLGSAVSLSPPTAKLANAGQSNSWSAAATASAVNQHWKASQ